MTAHLSREIAAIFRKVTNSNIDEEGNSHCVLTPADCVAINSARMLLAAMDSKPVAWWTGPEPTPTGEIESIHDHETGSHIIPLFAFYYSAPPAPVATVPDGLRMALSNAGIAAPESDEVLFATHEKYVQLLVDWVKDRKPFAPAPVAVPDVFVIPEPATLTNINQLCPLDKGLSQTDFATGWNECRRVAMAKNAVPPIVKGISAQCQGWNACRAAMLNRGKS